MSCKRRFKRYQVSHSDILGGNLTESDYQLKLASIGLGGCGFIGISSVDSLIPPKEIICSFFTKYGLEFKESQIVQGNLIYVRPANIHPFVALYYGVKFYDEERAKLAPLIHQLEVLDRKGLLR